VDEAIKQKWVEALRSGNYQQTQGALHKINDGYCCLGVLCEIEGLEWAQHGGKVMRPLNGTSPAYLPSSFAARVGLTKTQQNTLAALNDGGKPFNYIATVIERNF
jgi:hypothetical protein